MERNSETLDFKHVFLQTFVSELIWSLKEIKNIPYIPPKAPSVQPFSSGPQTRVQRFPRQRQAYPQTQIGQTEERIYLGKTRIKLKEIGPQEPLFHPPMLNSPMSSRFPPRIQATQTKTDLGKLNPIIHDPAIQSIECTGPGKNLLVRKGSSILSTRMSLTEEEIKKIIDRFSQEARIPVIKGVFKAAVGSLIITAVISDFIGTRFVIQKRNPFTPLNLNPRQKNQSTGFNSAPGSAFPRN